MLYKCKNSDNYQGKRPPTCNGGDPCVVCKEKWEQSECAREFKETGKFPKLTDSQLLKIEREDHDELCIALNSLCDDYGIEVEDSYADALREFIETRIGVFVKDEK